MEETFSKRRSVVICTLPQKNWQMWMKMVFRSVRMWSGNGHTTKHIVCAHFKRCAASMCAWPAVSIGVGVGVGAFRRCIVWLPVGRREISHEIQYKCCEYAWWTVAFIASSLYGGGGHSVYGILGCMRIPCWRPPFTTTSPLMCTCRHGKRNGDVGAQP